MKAPSRINNAGTIYKKTDLLIYQTSDGAIKIDVHVADDTVWLSLKQLAELFQQDKSVISPAYQTFLTEGELHPEETVAKYATVHKSLEVSPLQNLNSN